MSLNNSFTSRNIGTQNADNKEIITITGGLLI